MGWQCVPQVLGLVHGDGMRKDGKGQAKHRANVAAIVNEAFEIADQNDGHPIPIRKSASETYDRSRTVNNKYTGYQTADDVLAALEEEADKQQVEVAVTDKKTGKTVIHKRALPSTAVLGMAVIFNPPSEIAKDWPPEKYDKFFRDCEESMAQIPFGKVNKKGELVGDAHYLFRKENIIASAEHWDEGEPMDPPIYTGHIHDIYKPEGLDGKYYGKFIDALNLSCMVNRRFAGLMRERGWDIDDPDYTDWEKADKDKEYRARRKSKIRQGGKPVNTYIADKKLKDAEAHLEEAAAVVEQAAAIMEDVARREQEADEKVRVAEAVRDKALAERDEAISLKNQALEDKEQVEADASDALMERQRLELQNRLLDTMQATSREQLNALAENRNAASAEVQRLRTEITATRKERDDLLSEAAAAESDRDKAKAEAEELRRMKVRQAEAAANAERGRIMAEIEKEAAEKRDRAEARQKELDDAIAAAHDTLASLQTKIDGLQDLVRKAERKAQRIVEVAKCTAASIRSAAEGEHGFLVEFFGNEPFIFKNGKHEGKSYLEVARERYERQLRDERLRDMPTSVKDAGKGQQSGTEQDGPRK